MLRNFTIVRALVLSFLASIALLAHGQEQDNWYSVEVLIFANQDPNALLEEQWPTLEYPALRDAVSLQPSTEGDTIPFSLMSASQMTLNGARASLQRSGDYRVLLHTGWVQPVQRTRNPAEVRIAAGNILDNGRYELEGYLGVGRGQYLHIRPELYFSRQLSATESDRLRPAETEAVASTATASAPNLFIPEVLTVLLEQPRRMRSGEVHYIDHPLFGLIISVLPLDQE